MCDRSMCAHKQILTTLTTLTLPTMTSTFYLNRTKDKISFDKIVIRKNDDKFSVTYITEVTKDTMNTAKSEKFSLPNFNALMDYMKEILDLLTYDNDIPQFNSIDVMIPAYPVVALKVGVDNALLLRALRSWSKRN